ncbi:MAG: hypothetical protein AB7O26_18520 [Planctomycetaceae bacterium]
MKSRGLWVASLAVALVAVSSVEGFAQGRGGRGFGRSTTPLSIVSNDAVQKELGLNEEQAKKITALNEELNDERGKMFAELQASTEDLKSLPENEQREKRMAAMLESNKKLNDKFTPRLKEILDAKQQDRLKQISWQAAGTAAYSDPEVVKALGISQEQQDKLAAISKERDEKARAAFRDGGGGGFEGLAKMREEYDKKIAEVLSKEQQDKFTELKGKEFDVAQLRPAGRRGDRGDGGGRRRRAGAEGSSEKKSE